MHAKNNTAAKVASGEFMVSAIAGLLAICGGSSAAHAYDLTEWLSVGGVAAATGQCQLLTESAGAPDRCRGALPFQPELSIRPTGQDELFFKAGFAAGNGLNPDSPLTLAPWAADLHDDVTDINGRYDYLLNAWYKHTFKLDAATALPPESTLGVTFGIIDSTDFLDDNAYSNDEYTQYMNEALVNGPQSFLPSFDVGGAVEFDAGAWSLRGVAMNVGQGDEGDSFTFLGGQLGYTLDTSWGEGNYRVFVVGANREFPDPEGESLKSRLAVGLSFDQQLGETFGAWIRFGWQDDGAAVDYDAIYSGGINILGSAWGRPDDNIGIGYGYLDGGNLDISGTHVAEAYYRFAFLEHFAISADVQYMTDMIRGDINPGGFFLGLRGTAEF